MQTILDQSRAQGWVLEPEAKRFFSLAGLPVPNFIWAKTIEEALEFAGKNGFPVVTKIISPQVVHKSDIKGVVTGIANGDELAAVFKRFTAIKGFAGVLVEETVPGLELIIGAKMDYQFGPVVLLGIGGIAVELYKDTVVRMAPLTEADALKMLDCLKAHRLLEGYRGGEPVNLQALLRLLVDFSALAADMGEQIESIDLNPVLCNHERCVIADARIMFASS